ncbi:dipeptidyl aminopeptidase/acylaminoacyl peptidase [Sphingopyxis panaciterrae]|uniref:S9 family peptidase n=1 Tax=Sphingopyxis panaciterrae TaxID=363841 RepID=UPI0014220640|nr:prolyl oligopeptidase family serine peptidase [Sphingopyxis panaciterrae]NIJ39476.1 dipeptidyl aminopeptidase/acylaminoacyl peptidase [Sphingopyxis panaciterrae]
MIERDMREAGAARDVNDFYRTLFRPGEDILWTAADLDPTADGRSVHFTGQCFEGALAEGPATIVCRIDLAGGAVHRVARGRLYRNSPDGRAAYIEAGEDGRERLVILSEAREQLFSAAVDVRVEALAWAPGGSALLILGADAGADVSGAEGGYALRGGASGPSWLPDVAASGAQDLWRRLYRWSDDMAAPQAVTRPPVNVWEAAWLGDDRFAVVASDHHGEGSWYEASLRVIDAETGEERGRYVPAEQAGVPAGSPDGRYWAVIEAFCSDRGLVCGPITLGEEGAQRVLDTGGVEVSDIRWRDESRLLFAGVRDAETVVGEIDLATGERREHWSSDRLTISGWYPKAVPAPGGGALAVIEGYAEPPAIASLSNGETAVLAGFAPSPAPAIPGTMRYHRWRGRDGLEIGGWLVLPDGDASNLPLFVDIHGGPVWAHRNRYAAVLRAGPVLVAKGYALLLPNPRGSGGRGQDFARKVHRDMGGEDMHDYLAGIDSLVAAGIADPGRVGVSGTSYGGFMSAWLVTQTDRFAAAIPISPVANWYSQHYASQIPWFDQALLDGSPRRPGGQYFDRSPVFFAGGVTTPTLVLAGGRDKNTPTGQAIEFFGALTEAGAEAALAIYPEDGHSLRGYPAYLDSAARIVDWCERHIVAG